MASSFEKLTGGPRPPEKVASGLRLAAGPVFSRIGYLLFCDVGTNQILKWEAGRITTFRENANGARSLTFDHQGRLLVCERGRVTRTGKNGTMTVLADRCERPHDLVYAIDGSIYFTDQRQKGAAVYRIDRKGALHVAARDCRIPAGVALAPNQQRLYVSDDEIRVYDVAGDGSLTNGRPFAPVKADGLKTDEEGNVWCAAGDTISVLDAAGRKLGAIPLPETPGNCNWGAGFHDLYVTAKTSIYKVRANVNGTRTY